VQLAKVSERSFYDSLRGKLRWGGLSGASDGGDPWSEPGGGGAPA